MLLGVGEVPSDPGSRDRLLPDIDDFETTLPDRAQRLDEIEESFWADPENLYVRSEDLAQQHGLYPGY